MSADLITKEELVILSLYTGILFTKDFNSVHSMAEDLLKRPIMTHEFASASVWQELRTASKDAFMPILEKLNRQAEV